MMPRPRWEVTNQAEASDLGPQGRLIPGIRVYFTTKDNLQMSVFVPLAQYNAAQVGALIEAKVKEIEAVHALKSMT